ncbi:preprotein translocase subunit SecG [Aliidiomarina quisquiliarum]|uniref:preprotein translocase subunit SecG n=1 Tax=Aliidiomarina quisquiliarum TaxID=2938947 RepID=UPI00208ED73E|nr:preprotein translocase subunit SecG [Aliidiomarina quisquiliarum]MCO4321825.1 preprotein translocase subunit SecG [Aliidiomarina quisquiliarum]
MYETSLVIYLVVAIALIALILLQKGKGAEMGASFGSGASNTVFGATGSGNFLTRLTAILAVSFFLMSLILGNMAANQAGNAKGELNFELPTTEQTPVVPLESN